ncbi:MAG TPA: Spy/CpxP family protein refolding chaperone [Candidatus Deferrimicrobiaceae bacterium]
MNGKGGKYAVGALAGVAVLLLAVTLASAHGGRHGRGDCGEGVPGIYSGKVLDRLGVTGEQKAQIREVSGKYRPETEPEIRQLSAERRALRKMIQGGAADDAAIRGQAGKVASLEADLAVMRARAAREVRTLLTAEQLARLEELQAKRERKADRMMERRFRGDQGGKP